jgi:hypothetical protein
MLGKFGGILMRPHESQRLQWLPLLPPLRTQPSSSRSSFCAHGEREVMPAQGPGGKLQQLITCGARYLLSLLILDIFLYDGILMESIRNGQHLTRSLGAGIWMLRARRLSTK